MSSQKVPQSHKFNVIQTQISQTSPKVGEKSIASRSSLTGSIITTANTIESQSCSPKRKNTRTQTMTFSNNPVAKVQGKNGITEDTYMEEENGKYSYQKLNKSSKVAHYLQVKDIRNRTIISPNPNSSCASFRSIIEEPNSCENAELELPYKLEAFKIDPIKVNCKNSQKDLLRQTLEKSSSDIRSMIDGNIENQITPKRIYNEVYNPQETESFDRKSPALFSVDDNFGYDYSKDIPFCISKGYPEDRSYSSIPKASHRLSITSNVSINSNAYQAIPNSILSDLTTSLRELNNRLIKSEEVAYGTLVEHVRLLNSINGLKSKLEEQRKCRIEQKALCSSCSKNCLVF